MFGSNTRHATTAAILATEPKDTFMSAVRPWQNLEAVAVRTGQSP